MSIRRIGELIVVMAGALVLYGCTGSVGGGSAAAHGTIRTLVSFPPSDVVSVYLTASLNGTLAAQANMTGSGSSWSGGELDVPPGSGYEVTAYAFSGPLPEKPTSDTSTLIYKGQAEGVAVSSGETTPVTIVLIPWPNVGPQPGINTPPHIVFGSHPSSMRSTDTVELSAAAWDPDPGTLLSYAWDDGEAGGSFFGGSGQSLGEQVPGNTVSVNYRPAEGFVGTVTIRLVVSDGTATVYQTFTIEVESADGTIEPTLEFDSGPEVAITGITSQSLAPQGTALITYQVTGGSGNLVVSWTDDCLGQFSGYSSDPDRGESVTAMWQAPANPPQSPGQCDLTLNVWDSAGASTWVSLVVWVDNGQDLSLGKTVFTTSNMVQAGYFNGDPAQADSLCQAAASQGSLPGTYKAFMSFSTVNAKDRIPEGPYYLPDGTLVATSKANLLGGSLLHALDLDESRNLIEGDEPNLEVWTGTGADGTLYGNNLAIYQCGNWTISFNDPNDFTAIAGNAALVDSGWTARVTGGPWWYWCGDYKHIYCFQQ